MAGSVGFPERPGRRNSVIPLVLLAISVALNLALAVVVIVSKTTEKGDAAAIDKAKFYVVNLADNESFVGHVQDLNGTQLTLADVYNLSVQAQPGASPAPGASPNPQLNPVICKLGTTGCKQLTGLYGNKDTLYIARNAVIYYSELPASSKVVQAIVDYEKKNPPGH